MARPLVTPEQGEQAAMEKMAPVLAQAVLGNAGMVDPEIKALMLDMLEGIAEKRKKEKDLKERIYKQSLITIQQQAEAKAEQQGRCSHLKQDGRSTRCAGQVTTGIGGKRQLVLVCQFCQKEYHMPPFEGQEAPPQHLIPPPDEIGG